MIVASILLAFAIDAAWAQRQVRSEEREALAALEAEFTANLTQVDRVIEVYRAGRESLSTLSAATPAELRALSQRSISEIMLATTNVWTFDPVLGATDALVGAGRLSIIRNAQLREALASFANLVADADGEVPALSSLAEAAWVAEVKHGGPWTDPETEIGWSGAILGFEFLPKATAEDLMRVRSDPEFMGVVSRLHLNAAYYVGELERVRAQIVRALELIAEER